MFGVSSQLLTTSSVYMFDKKIFQLKKDFQFQSSIGSLSVRSVQIDKDGSKFRPLLKAFDKNLGNRWQNAKIDFTPLSDSQVRYSNSPRKNIYIFFYKY